jgi:histidyl-tRNA synthetase
MGPVWRGENTGQGRYREFWQVDFDTIGTLSNAADVETALVIHDLMVALGLERFEIRINNRLLLNGVLEQFGMADKAEPILRTLDKLPKLGRDATRAEMEREAGVTAEQADKVLDLASTTGDNRAILAAVERAFGSHAYTAEGIGRLRQLLDVAERVGIPPGRIRIDLSICRGLAYYTGTVYETFLSDLPDIGSVCSGGRYDNLAAVYTKQALPGVGASLGLDRLLAALEQLETIKSVATPAPVLIVQFSADRLGDYQRIARALRGAGVGAEVYPEAKKVGAQLQYAERRGFRLALIAGPDEFAQSVWKIKDLAQREEVTVPEFGVVDAIKGALNLV